MTQFDFAPLLRSTVGFDRLSRLIDEQLRTADPTGYPPYNIEKTGDNDYRIAMAVAGFAEDELALVQQDTLLVISGQKTQSAEQAGAYLHRGIAQRAFERRFQLADYIRVVGAKLENGLLHVDLVREVPEALKPRRIPVEAAPAATRTIAAQAA
jgi:molecular chaperone IbpA